MAIRSEGSPQGNPEAIVSPLVNPDVKLLSEVNGITVEQVRISSDQKSFPPQLDTEEAWRQSRPTSESAELRRVLSPLWGEAQANATADELGVWERHSFEAAVRLQERTSQPEGSQTSIATATENSPAPVQTVVFAPK